MANTNFTPGPWRAGSKGQENYIFDPKGRAIVQSCKIADTHLIAAAPDLLLHLQGFVAHCALFHEHEFEEMINAAKAVIAQAKGE